MAKLERAERRAAKKAARRMKHQKQSEDVEQSWNYRQAARSSRWSRQPDGPARPGSTRPVPTSSVAAGARGPATAITRSSPKPARRRDVEQGGVGDCYYLSVLSSVAKTNPTVIRESVVDLGDGTYWVQFTRRRQQRVRPCRWRARRPGNFNYCLTQLGAQESMWVAMMEKAYALFRTGAGTNQSIEAAG